MHKTLKDNTLVLSILTAAILGGVGFWRTTETKLAVMEKDIATLQKQVEKLEIALFEVEKLVY
jgi:hypothetical protein